MNFAENLKNLRIKENVSQIDLSKETGIPQSVISRFERGKLEPKLSSLQKLAKFFNISIDKLVDGVD